MAAGLMLGELSISCRILSGQLVPGLINLRKYPNTITVFPTYRSAVGLSIAASTDGLFGMVMVIVILRFQSRPW